MLTITRVLLRQHDVQLTLLLSFAALCAVVVATRRRWSSAAAAVGAAAGLALVVAMTLAREGSGVGMRLSALRHCGRFFDVNFGSSEHRLNLMLFMPFAFFAVLATRRLLLTVVACVVLSAAIEAVQAITARGTCESGDVIRNCLGAAVAAFVGQLVLRSFVHQGG